MKLLGTTLVGILVLTLCSSSSVRSPPSQWTRDPGLDDQWQEYLTKFDKVYSTPEEIVYRRSVWEGNLKKIERHNAEADQGLHTWWMGVNQFTDMGEDEVSKMFSKLRPEMDSVDANDTMTFPLAAPPAQLDWRQSGKVTPVKNQGSSCGSCYAFAVVGSIESAYAIKKGVLEEFSEQEIVDCTKRKPYDNKGCTHGRKGPAMQYVIDVKTGIDKASCYPYIGKENPSCKRVTTPKCLGAVVHSQVTTHDEKHLLDSVVKGPTSVTVCVPPSFSSYRKGIYNDACPKNPDRHSMLVVGYGTDKNKPFWIIKNSHGTTFGENGYIRIARGHNAMEIADFAVRPVV